MFSGNRDSSFYAKYNCMYFPILKMKLLRLRLMLLVSVKSPRYDFQFLIVCDLEENVSYQELFTE